MLRLYTDVHFPFPVVAGLRRRGLDVLISQADGTTRLDDVSLLRRASLKERILLSQDTDLLRIARAWQDEGREFPGLVFCPQHRVGIGHLVEDLEIFAKCCTAEEVANCVTYLPL